MSPRMMLLLWRERWGKAGEGASRRPYLDGMINRWGDRLMGAQIWFVPGFLPLIACLSALALSLVAVVNLSLNSQIVLAVLLVVACLYSRRYGGPWVTLLLVALAGVASVRYFAWRFGATLSSSLDIAFVLGFALCAGELYLWVLKSVDLWTSRFPLKQVSVPLPANPDAWPTVDVLIPCHGLSPVALERAVCAARALEWPDDKIRRFLIDDGGEDRTVRLLADSQGFIYLESPVGGRVGGMNRALSLTQGDWILVFDGESMPEPHLLNRVLGWGTADPTIGMMQTPDHFLVPPPSRRSRSILGTCEQGAQFALIRRTAIMRVGGLTPEPVTVSGHTALAMNACGFRTAGVGYSLGHATDNHSPRAAQEVGASDKPDLEVFRVDQPFSDKALYVRQGIERLRDALQFYRLVPWLVVFAAPLVYLLFGVNPIQSSAALLLAYWVPHALQSYIAQTRLEGNTRRTEWEELKEGALAIYVLCATALSVTRTECSQWLRGRPWQDWTAPDRLTSITAWLYAVVLGLTLLGFLGGILQSVRYPHLRHDMAGLYAMWAVYNVLLLSAVLAVARESQHIRQHTRRQSQRPAVLRLPTGQVVSCVTRNFPELVLCLEHSLDLNLAHGDRVNVSIFRHQREFVFPAGVVTCPDKALWVNIEPAVQPSYRALGAAVFSRGPDWPKWLPGRDADQPFPPWAIKAFEAVRVAALSLQKRLGDLSWWLLLGGWIQAWKKR